MIEKLIGCNTRTQEVPLRQGVIFSTATIKCAKNWIKKNGQTERYRVGKIQTSRGKSGKSHNSYLTHGSFGYK